VNDVDLIWELTEAVRNDSEAPVLNQRFNPIDPIAIEIILHEADFAVENYMEKWKNQYRERFADPTVYDNFVLEFQMKVRKDVKAMIASAQQFIAEELEQERNEDEGDEYEGQN
jgi:hypothetical protein